MRALQLSAVGLLISLVICASPSNAHRVLQNKVGLLILRIIEHLREWLVTYKGKHRSGVQITLYKTIR
jgi:hypothetical protein